MNVPESSLYGGIRDVHGAGHPFIPVLPLRSRQNQAMKWVALLLALASTALAACGGSEEDQTTIPGGADPAAVAVIDDWAQTLNEGDVDGAAEFFALPSIAQNGPTLRINDIEDARLFNSSLPCGAILEEAVTDEGFTIATFELTERPGPGTCGSGTGAEAKTAFKIEDGKITEWRRVVDEGEDTGPPQAPSSST